jgi:serine/threonine-protein kinase HipA
VTELVVTIGGVRAGLLRSSNEGSSFELDDEYLERADRPILGQVFEDDPRGRRWTRQGVPSWFANLLPEGPLRRLIAERAGVDQSRSLFLLCLLGEDLPGAVTVHPQTPAGAAGAPVEAPSTTVLQPGAQAPLLFSLAGVQLKFSAVVEGRGLTIPARGAGGDWIVKLPDERFTGVPENEYLMMSLAGAAGIEVPEIRLLEVREIGGLPPEVAGIAGRALAVRRFDRPADGARVHIEDFAQVLGLAPHEKYRATSYDRLARVVDELCGPDDVDELLRRLVFAVAIGNSDAHAKNWSLIYPNGRTARLAPAYDLVAVSLYERIEPRLRPRLALRLADATHAEEVEEATFRRLAQRAKLDEERTIEVVRGQVHAIKAAWAELREPTDTPLDPQLRDVLDERFEGLPLLR